LRQLPGLGDALVRPPEAAMSAFYLDLGVDDSPGVLAQVSGAFGANSVSIKSMEQQGLGAEANLVFITHQASEADMAATIEKLTSLPSVKRVGALYRVMGS